MLTNDLTQDQIQPEKISHMEWALYKQQKAESQRSPVVATTQLEAVASMNKGYKRWKHSKEDGDG